MAKNKKNRTRFSTTLDERLLSQAEILQAVLKNRGTKKDGINDLIEEGLNMVIEKYSEETGVNIKEISV